MCDEFLMGCTLVTAFVHLCVLFAGILVHLVATLTGYDHFISTQSQKYTKLRQRGGQIYTIEHSR